MSWQLYIAVSVVLFSISMLMQRVMLHRYHAKPIAFASLFQLVVAAVLLPVALINGMSFDGFSALLPQMLLTFIGFGLGSIVYNEALERDDASAFSVLFATQAVWVMLVGLFFLGESLGLIQVAGTVLIFASVAMLIPNLRSLRLSKGVSLGLLTGLLYGISIATMSYVGRHVDILTWSFVDFLFSGLTVLLLKPSAIHQFKPLLHGKLLPMLATLGVLYGAGNVAMLLSYKYGPLSLVAPVRQTGILLTTLLAFIFIRDERTHVGRKILAAAVCTVGVCLIVL